MATFIGEDRSGRVATLVDDWPDLLPITAQEAELLKQVRQMQDMRHRREQELGKFDAQWSASDEQQLLLAQRIAMELICRPDSGWVVLEPTEARLAADALIDVQRELPDSRYKRDCDALVAVRFVHVE